MSEVTTKEEYPKQARATLYKPDGSSEEVEPANGKDFTLGEAQELVGGYVELLPLPNNTYAFFNEEGRLKGLPYNANVSQIAEVNIVGNAVVCPRSMFK